MPENKKLKKEYYQANKSKAAAYGLEYRRTPIGRYKKLKSAAARRDIDFNISFEEYLSEISKPCFYCKGFFGTCEAGGGLDRIDNTKGYITDNILSCCKVCNRLKNEDFSSEETMAAIRAIIKLRKNK